MFYGNATKSPERFDFTIFIVIVCTMLSLSSCRHELNDTAASSSGIDSQPTLRDVAPMPDNRASVLRKKIHQQMVQSNVVSRREAWAVLAEGAATSSENMTLFYTRRTIQKSHKASGANQAQLDYWNREHLWPRSFGLKRTSADFDLYNLVPVDRTVNSSRGNKVFDMAYSPHHECNNCRVSSQAWEPPDEVKGDIARVIFYMDVRYEGLQVSEVEKKNPNLTIGEIPDASVGRFGPLSTLLKWHCGDEVSDAERVRQEVIYNAQGNRNVFVDDSSLVEKVYDFDCSDVIVWVSEILD